MDEPKDDVLTHAARVIADSEIVRLLFLEEERGLSPEELRALEELLEARPAAKSSKGLSICQT
jgi:hypothetical protein